METYFSTVLEITQINQEKYDLLIDFLEDNNINYDTTDFEEYTIDTRSDSEKYDDWLWTLADERHDETSVGNDR